MYQHHFFDLNILFSENITREDIRHIQKVIQDLTGDAFMIASQHVGERALIGEEFILLSEPSVSELVKLMDEIHTGLPTATSVAVIDTTSRFGNWKLVMSGKSSRTEAAKIYDDLRKTVIENLNEAKAEVYE